MNEELDRLVAESKEKGLDKIKVRQIYDIANKSVEEILSDGVLLFTSEQYTEITTGIYNGLSDEEIKSYITYENAEDMKNKRIMLEAFKNRKRMEGNA